MPKGDGTGPSKSSIGPRDGRGKEKAGRGQKDTKPGMGAMTGGKKGTCKSASPYKLKKLAHAILSKRINQHIEKKAAIKRAALKKLAQKLVKRSGLWGNLIELAKQNPRITSSLAGTGVGALGGGIAAEDPLKGAIGGGLLGGVAGGVGANLAKVLKDQGILRDMARRTTKCIADIGASETGKLRNIASA